LYRQQKDQHIGFYFIKSFGNKGDYDDASADLKPARVQKDLSKVEDQMTASNDPPDEGLHSVAALQMESEPHIQTNANENKTATETPHHFDILLRIPR
jgi:hypothetical protein